MSTLADTLALQLRTSKILPAFEREVRFHPKRLWRLDFFERSRKLAVEVNGGIYIPGGGRHNRGAALEKEYEKLNAAAEMGIVVLLYGPKAVANGNALRNIECCWQMLRPTREELYEQIEKLEDKH